MSTETSNFTIASSIVNADGIRQWCFTLPITHPDLTADRSLGFDYLSRDHPRNLVHKVREGRHLEQDPAATELVIQAASLRAALLENYALPTKMSFITDDCARKGLVPLEAWSRHYQKSDKKRAKELSDPSSYLCQDMKMYGEELIGACVTSCDELTDADLLSQFKSGLANACQVSSAKSADQDDVKGDILKICEGDLANLTITVTAAMDRDEDVSKKSVGEVGDDDDDVADDDMPGPKTL